MISSTVRISLITPILVVIVLCAFIFCADARADSDSNLYYLGAALGQSSEEISNLQYVPGYLHFQPLGWKLLIGTRPLPYVGGEVEYIDFGKGHSGPRGFLSSAESHDRAGAAFIVGYLPLPQHFDLFGKIGGARYRTSYHFNGDFSDQCFVNPVTSACISPGKVSVSGSTDATAIAYGVGAQYHINRFAIRAEYERIASTYPSEQPSLSISRASGLALASIGVIWSF